MLLTIDIGNSNVLMGIYDSDLLIGHWRFLSESSRTSDEWGMMLMIQVNRLEFKLEKIDGVIISSVVPSLNPIFREMTEHYLNQKPMFIGPEIELGIKVMYEEPNMVGSDRLCNAVAGYEKYGGPLIVIDFGTATTYDVILKDGSYLGGIISPGIQTASEILHLKAAKLPLVEQKFPNRKIGRNTEESIQSGIMYGAVVQVEGLVNLIKREINGEPKTIATGGIAKLIKDKTKIIDFYEPFLILEGLNLIYKRNKKL